MNNLVVSILCDGEIPVELVFPENTTVQDIKLLLQTELNATNREV